MAVKSHMLQIGRCMLLLGLIAVCCVSCDTKNRQGQSEDSEYADQRPKNIEPEPASSGDVSVLPQRQEEAKVAAVSEWGSPVGALRCRVRTCVLVPDDDPDYGTRINIALEILNTSKLEKDVRILVPHSGEPLLAVMMPGKGGWQSIGNASVGPNSDQDVFRIGPGRILKTSFSEGLSRDDAARIKQGASLKCILIAYGKGLYDPASLLSGEFTVSDTKSSAEAIHGNSP